MAVGSSDEFDELRFHEVVAQGSLDFEAWTSLISTVEHNYHDDIDEISLVYDSFLSEFPLCYGYWKKYAEHKARLCSGESVAQIFERAVESAPYSVGVWVDYCNFGVSSLEDPSEIFRLFQRGLSFIGRDYLCYNLWDKCIEFEFAQQHWNSLANIYIQTLKFPTKKLHQYYESFKKLVAIWEEEIGFQGSSSIHEQLAHDKDDKIKTYEDTEISQVISDLLDPSARSEALLKYVSIGEQFYRRACDLDAKVHKFEQNIHRPYFHVKPLDDNQLQNWHSYLDLVEEEDDFDWAVKLYERCLISCANYPEFWMRYVEYVESKGGREIALDALERATHIFLKNAPEIHLYNAWYKEKNGDVDGVHAAFQQCDQDSESCFIDIVRRKANMERRLGNYVAAYKVYEDALDLASEKRPDTLPILYVHFARLQYMIKSNAEAAREVLLNGIQHVPQSKVLLKELVLFALMHEGAIEVDTVDSIMAKALALALDNSGGIEEWEELSNLYLEFVDLCGSIHDVRRAWKRHLKLFPHLLRFRPSLKNPAKAGVFWKMVRKGRPDDVDTHPQNPLENRGEEMPLQKEKPLVNENVDKSEDDICGQEQSEDGNSSPNDLEPVPSEVMKTQGVCKANEQRDHILHESADDRDPMEVVKGSKLTNIQQEQQGQEQEGKPGEVQRSRQEKPPSRSQRLDPPRKTSLSNGSKTVSGRNIVEGPSASGARSPDNNGAERCKESPGPSSTIGHKNFSPEVSARRSSDRDGNWRRNPSSRGRSDFSPSNSEERLERSLSPRRRSSHGYVDDRRRRERSLSPRRYSSRWQSEERWQRERRHRRYNRYQDNSRGHRDVRMQNQSQVVVANSVQMPNAQQQTTGFVSQTQPNVQPITYTQAQINQCPPPSNDQYGNVPNSQLYNQMWQQYYYYNQQQQQQTLLPQQPLVQQQQLQQIQPNQQLQQQVQNPAQQQIQAPQYPQQIQPNQQQLLHLQYQHQQLYQLSEFQQQNQPKQTNEMPQSKEQESQLQLPQQQLHHQLQVQQQEQQQQAQNQVQQQPQVQQQEDVDVQRQQQAFQYQQLQQQQYLLYLQQLQYQHTQSQQQPGPSQDQHSLQQQPFPAKQEQQEHIQELQHTDEKSRSQPLQDDGSSLVGQSQYQQGSYCCFGLFVA